MKHASPLRLILEIQTHMSKMAWEMLAALIRVVLLVIVKFIINCSNRTQLQRVADIMGLEKSTALQRTNTQLTPQQKGFNKIHSLYLFALTLLLPY